MRLSFVSVKLVRPSVRNRGWPSDLALRLSRIPLLQRRGNGHRCSLIHGTGKRECMPNFMPAHLQSISMQHPLK